MISSLRRLLCFSATFGVLSFSVFAQEAAPGQEPVVEEAPVEVEDPKVVFPKMLKTITEDECYDLVQTIAGLDMRGRGTMTPGFDKAADFVVEELKALGYEGAGDKGSFRIPINLSCLIPGEDCSFDWSSRSEEVNPPKVEQDFVPVLGTAALAAEGEAVFVGYAIDSKKDKWVDLKPRDVKGKIVFAFTREPRADDTKSKRFEGSESTRESSIQRKAQAVFDAGGIGLVLVPDPGLVAEAHLPLPGMVPYVTRGAANPQGIAGIVNMPEIPVVSVSREIAAQIFATDIEAYAKSMDKRLKPKLLKAGPDSRVSFKVSLSSGSRQAYNLGAVIRGSSGDGQVVILGAHLDHVGFDMLTPAESLRASIHPGADDNASGSAALLEVAEAFAGHQPQSDVLFLWFTGEEIGLLGSTEYCKEPLYPHENTIAMLNMDMVGRGDDDLINIGGLWSRPEWEKFIKDIHKRSRSRLKMDNDQGRDLYARSDQYSFHQEGVVGLFFFEADLNKNKVYHQVGDVAETIDGKKMERIAQLFAATAWALAFEGERP